MTVLCISGKTSGSEAELFQDNKSISTFSFGQVSLIDDYYLAQINIDKALDEYKNYDIDFIILGIEGINTIVNRGTAMSGHLAKLYNVRHIITSPICLSHIANFGFEEGLIVELNDSSVRATHVKNKIKIFSGYNRIGRNYLSLYRLGFLTLDIATYYDDFEPNHPLCVQLAKKYKCSHLQGVMHKIYREYPYILSDIGRWMMQNLEFEDLHNILASQVKLLCEDIKQNTEKNVVFTGELSEFKIIQNLILEQLPHHNITFSSIHSTKAGLAIDNPKFKNEKWDKVFIPK